MIRLLNKIMGMQRITGVVAIALVMLTAMVATPCHAQQTAAQNPADACSGLEGGRFAGLAGAATWIVKATYHEAAPNRPAYCAIDGYINPEVNFGIYLPVGNWNGRFLMRGCGGSCGTVPMELACADHQRYGYACIFTDMGHRSTLNDNNWTAGNLQGLVDFGYRATHVTVMAGKAIARAFYGRDPDHSYYFGCSTGGRQGMVEIERFPGDFDGVVAMAPAGMGPLGVSMSASVSDIAALNRDAAGSPILPDRKALLIHRAVVDACDMNDGVRDGLIGDPRLCRFRPESLRCTSTDTSNCLTGAQIAVANAIYEKRGASKGSEFNWIGAFLADAPMPGEPPATVPDLGQGRGDPIVIDTLNNPGNPDLRQFAGHGGKLILVHGWDDPSVMPPPTIDYYETMTRTMGGPAATRGFARLFMIPGMDHCAGGSGAYAIDYMQAIVDWVEGGKAPDVLKGIHPLPGAPLDFFSVRLRELDPRWVGFVRDHPAYPQVERGGDGSGVAKAGTGGPPLTDAGLAAMLSAAIAQSEHDARAAFFPRRNIRNAISQAMWHVLYEHPADIAAQRGAIAKVRQDAALSDIARDAVEHMAWELTRN